MKTLDLVIIFGYLIGIVLFGSWFARKQQTTRDYFLGDRSVPWWAVAFSIVATETSTITFASVVLIGIAMIVFTYFGGMEAVIWVEVVQLGIYLAGAVAAAVILTNSIDGGLSTAIATATQFHKFSLFDFTLDATKTFTFWSGVIGGCFLTMSTH